MYTILPFTLTWSQRSYLTLICILETEVEVQSEVLDRLRLSVLLKDLDRTENLT